MKPSPISAATASPQRLGVALDAHSYDIVIGEALLAQAGDVIRPLLPQSRVIIVTDKNVAEKHLTTLHSGLAGIRHESIILPPGEQTKSFTELDSLMQKLLALQPDRKTTLIAFGGGVVGDLTGFAASILLRGVPFIQIPTTLLAQVDSSVGGKTGINTPQGKNLVGSFYQPLLVLADTSVLDTLPRRQLLAGYAEIAKYGLINDEPFFAWLEMNGKKVIEGDAEARRQAIHTSCAAKAAIVARDEKESGERALLNLGHTFGHALEAETGFSDKLLHGEAVAIGICMAYEFSAHLKLCPPEHATRATRHFKSVGLHASPLDISPEWNTARMMQHFRQDKKAEGGKLTFILTRGIGKSFIEKNVDENILETWLNARLKHA